MERFRAGDYCTGFTQVYALIELLFLGEILNLYIKVHFFKLRNNH